MNNLSQRGERPGVRLWFAALVGLGGFLVAGLRGPLAHAQLVSPQALFWLVVVAASLCWIVSVALVMVGWLRGLAELAILGAALAVQSGFGIVHGLTVPGVLYGPNNAVMSSAFIALPAALAAALPVIVPRSRFGPSLGRHWRAWAMGWVLVGSAACGVLLAHPDVVVAPSMSTATPVAVGVVSLLAAVALSVRHLRLYWVGRLRASLVVSIAFLWLGLSGLVWLGHGPFSVGFWTAHVFDIAGVAVGALALLFGYRTHGSVARLMAPVIMRDPLVALDLGLSPIAHRFVAMLDRKDPVSRDHVIRVGEMAVRSGERAGLRGTRLRNLGLAALLHDIGKLEIPEDILTKPGALTEEESAIMRTHPAIGERLMLSEPELAPAATFVRLHHERNDGRGYPDGKRGAEIPVEVGIISAADAFDAMCHTRPYREGMGQDRALAILREHAGSQWSEVAVAVVVAAVESGDAEGSALDDVGRSGLDLTMGVAPDVMSAEIACGCADAIPEDVRHLALTGNSLR